jgi:hypothetical protein
MASTGGSATESSLIKDWIATQFENASSHQEDASDEHEGENSLKIGPKISTAIHPMKSSRTLPALALLTVILTSCTTPTKYPETDANGKKIEYVYITPPGSNIPIKVRKDSVQMSDTDAAAQDKAFTDLQREAPVSPPPNTGGK